MRKTKIAVLAFGIATLIFSILASDQLVLLARVSFAGTSLLAPMVISGVLSKHPPGIEVIGATAVGLLLFLGAKLAFIPETILGVRMDLLLLLSLAAITVASYAYHRRREAVAAE
jgi:SSS family solute:Na+ symporter